ncbi:MAG TPA: glycosyltransferase family 4 protein [Chthoniobacterales bacterium]|jgi:UDP-glucose:(heptosyl)LPS alpha-1,3-glucosyltransferase
MIGQTLRIVFVRRGYSASGGAEAYLKRLARGLVDLGHMAELLTTEDWPETEWPSGPLTRIAARSTIGFADEVEKIRPQMECDVLMSLERIWRCDVFRAGDGVHRAWLNRRKKFDLPLQRLARDVTPKHRRILQLEDALLATRGATRVIVASELVKNEIVDLYYYPADKIELVRNGVPLDRFRFDAKLRGKSRADLKLHPDEIALLFAGSGWERKGLLFAMEAMAMCRGHKLRLLVAGRGKTQSYFKSRRVRFLGEVVDLLPVYAAADIFILPTIYDPFSNACLEALACGLPVITTRANGFSEIIEHQVHGSIVERGNDLTSLRNAIEFWSDPARRAAARSTITARASQFDISKNVEQTLGVLMRVASG